MGLGKFIQSIFNTQVLGEETIGKQEEVYQQYRKRFPNKDPHFYLAQVWLSRIAAHGNNPNDPDLQMLSCIETFLCACIPPPQCAKALGLYILYKERPDIIEKHKTFQEEYVRLMQPVFKAQENGTIEELYRRYNPHMASQMFSEEDQSTKKLKDTLEQQDTKIASATMNKENTFYAHILKAVIKSKNDVKNGVLPTKIITSAVNAKRPKSFQLASHRVAMLLTSMGFRKAKMRNGPSAIIWDNRKIKHMEEIYGLRRTSDTSEIQGKPGKLKIRKKPKKKQHKTHRNI